MKLKGWYPINWLYNSIFLYLSQARIRISNTFFRGPFCVLWFWVIGCCFVDIGDFVDYHCLNFLFIHVFF